MAAMATNATELGDIYACGWRIWTGLPLPATLPWPGPEAGDPDITFVAGAVPEALPDAALDRDVLQIATDGTALARFPGIGRFLIRQRSVTCELEVAPHAPELVPAIFGNVLACICWRRDQLALHGSAVAIDGRAALLIGPVATGKSVLAAALARRGHVVLCDELTAVRGGQCLPAGAPLQLADDALRAAGADPEPLPVYRNFPIPKRHWTGGPAPEPRPYPVAAVIRLRKGDPDAALVAEPGGADTVIGETYWSEMLDLRGSRAVAIAETEQLIALAAVHRLAIPRTLDRVEDTAEFIEHLVRFGSAS